jgi:single-stranded-DNA-specific exonuclease
LEEIPEGTKLVIALDASSNEYDLHKELKEKGMDVLIIDHHLAPKVSEYACVINNQLCDYPTKSLSGVGMVYKFCSYLDSLLGVNYASQYLDLVSLGMVADMMDLRDFETKHLIHEGFDSVRSPFIKMMMARQEFSIKGVLTPMTIGFYIAPYVNAVARVGT